MIELTTNPIDVSKTIEAAKHPSAGGLNIFIGTVRDFNAKYDKRVLHLDFEAYEPMAVEEIQKIMTVAIEQWDIKGWAISHSLATLMPGEIAVIIAVSTTHRKASFEACQFIIDQLKEKVPIWKKEVFEDGEEWVSAHP
jgi:molybdopterin synthase catalytic subunit